jgi:hypothetical protein
MQQIEKTMGLVRRSKRDAEVGTIRVSLFLEMLDGQEVDGAGVSVLAYRADQDVGTVSLDCSVAYAFCNIELFGKAVPI